MHVLFTTTSDFDVLVDDSLTGQDWLRAALIVVGAVVASMIANRLTRHALARWIGPGFASLITARLIGYLVFLLGLFYALNSLGIRVGPLLGALGLGGLVLALALQKVVENFVAAIILQTRRPFTVGDTVRIGDELGIVTDIDSRTTVLRGLDGTVIRIPNVTVVADTITNLTRHPSRRSSLVVGVTYDTNLAEATESLHTAVSLVESILADPPPSILLTAFSSSSIDFTILYWHASDVPSELAARHELVMAVHHTFSSNGITIAFPQVVVWTGSEGTGEPIYPGPLQPPRAERVGPSTGEPADGRRPGSWRRSRRGP